MWAACSVALTCALTFNLYMIELQTHEMNHLNAEERV